MPKNKEKASNPNTSKKQKEIKHDDKDKKQDKLTMRRLISNVFYVVKCALRIDKALVFLVIGAFVTCGIIYALFDTLFLKSYTRFYHGRNLSHGNRASHRSTS